jgi:hypothetical protein
MYDEPILDDLKLALRALRRVIDVLAVPFVCGATSCPKKPHPWC